MTTFDDFRIAAISHLLAAQKLLDQASAPSRTKVASSAAYLAMVSLECVLKARILYRGGYENDEELKRKHPNVHAALFKSAKGHSIDKLAEQLRADRIPELERPTMLKGDVWKRVSSADRPYSLRYGSEQLSWEDTDAEIAHAALLHKSLLSSLPTRTKRTLRT